MRAAILLALLLIAAPAQAQQAGEVWRVPDHRVRVDSASEAHVWYTVLISEATPSTVGRQYRQLLPAFVGARVLDIPVVPPAPEPPDTTPEPPAPEPPVEPTPPTDTTVYRVPITITADCSADMTSAIADWIATVPDSSTLLFAEEGCYRINEGLTLTMRHGLTIDGSGATFTIAHRYVRKLTHWYFLGGSNITIRNMHLWGGNGGAGVNGTYDPNLVDQHGVSFRGVKGATVEDVTVAYVYGDCLYAGGSTGISPGPVTDLTVRGLKCSRTGRHGIGLTNVERVLVEDSDFDEIRWSAVDVEPGTHAGTARDIMFRRNTFGNIRHSLVAVGGKSSWPLVGRITFTQNRQVQRSRGCVEPLRWFSTPGSYRHEMTITDNYFMPGCRAMFMLKRLKDVTVADNYFDYTGNPGDGLRIPVEDVHGALIERNTGTLNVILAADELSTGIIFR
jgi:hypothetical protein